MLFCEWASSAPAHLGDAMSMRQLIVIFAALALGCGTLQPSMAPEQEVLADGFPKPHPAQQRPGKDGKCRQSESDQGDEASTLLVQWARGRRRTSSHSA